uniref:Ankyrin repeat protein n=1 Tax=Panagrolaimus superbus TaxID=310955 RepID=A0A914Y910_9BILA
MSTEATILRGNLPPQIRVKPIQSPPEVKTPPQESSNTVQSPHILDPLAKRIVAVQPKISKPLSISPPPSSKSKSNEEEEIIQILTQDDFLPLKDKPYPEVDMEQSFDQITSASFSVRKIARNYDEFVAAVLTGDSEIVYATTMIGTFDLKLNEVDSKGKSILHHVAERKCDESHSFDTIIEILVQKKADLSLTDKENSRTPLHTAIVLRHTCLAKMFIQLGSPVNTMDSKKFSPLISAMNTRDANLVKMLLNAGANVEKGITYSERSKATTDEITDMLIAHRTKIITCLDEARNYILPQASVSTYGTLPTSFFVTPLAESDVIEFAFHLTKDTTIRPPNNYLLFECAVLDLDVLNETISARMWQQSPIKKIIINGTEPISLHKTTNFMSLPTLFEGINSVRIELMNQVYKGTKFCLTARLAHVFMAGFSRSKRLEPTIGNLLPQMMGNPSGYRSHVTPGIRQLSNDLRPKYFRTPGQHPSQPSSLQQSIATKRMMPSSRPYPPVPIASSSSQYRLPLSASSSQIPTTTTPSPFNFGAEPHNNNRSPTTPSSSTSSPLPPGFIPLKSFAQNGASSTSSTSSSSMRIGANRPMFAPLSAASNRIALRPPSSSTPPTTTTTALPSSQSRSTSYATTTPSTIPRLQRQ